MDCQSIQVFACDHRKNVQWNLPYVRLGNFQSDAAINIKDDAEIAPYQLLLSEGAQMWWVNKHYNELGNPDFVGFVHYRRFFTFMHNAPIMNIPASTFDPAFCARPAELLDIAQQKKLDGLTFQPLPVTSDDEHKYVDICEQLKYLAKGMNIPCKLVDWSFEDFLQNCKDEQLKALLKKAMSFRNSYVCNIFMLKARYFHEYCDIAFPTFVKMKQMLSDNELKDIHPRFMGYILERFTSMYLYAIQLRGQQIGIMPLMTLDAHIHEKWSKPQ